jgi:hypothetical protein
MAQVMTRGTVTIKQYFERKWIIAQLNSLQIELCVRRSIFTKQIYNYLKDKSTSIARYSAQA